MEEILKKIYYDPARGLGSAEKLHKEAKKELPQIKLLEVKNWLSKQQTQQIFKKTVKPVYPPITGPQGTYQADLMFLTQYKTMNNGYHIIFNFIEVTSRKAYAYPLKKKDQVSINDAYNKFLKEIEYKIINLTTDNGSEFISKSFQNIDDEYNITHYFVDTNDKNKMGKVERFNRTLRTKIAKYLKTFSTFNWIGVLPDLISNYNNTVHSSTGIEPNSVTSEKAEIIRAETEMKKKRALNFLHKFKVGDKVRMIKKKSLFDKGTKTFSKSLYTIEDVDKLALILRHENGNLLDRRVKPYNVMKVDVVEKPQLTIHEDRVAQKKEVKFIKKQKKVDAFKGKLDEKGNVEFEERDKPKGQKRERVRVFKINDRVKSLFNVGKEKEWFEGTVIKINPQTIRVKFDDGDIHNMKRDEIKLI